MKLKFFSTQTMPKGAHGPKGTALPKLRFTGGGALNLNKSASELIGATAGSKITIANDEEDPMNFYIFIDPDHGFELRGKDLQKGLQTNHKKLCVMIKTALERDPDSPLAFTIAGQPTTMKGSKTHYWGLIPVPEA